ncbi:hypothetical protein D910_02254 [Dendroctonus ponderosae]|uniref:Uncharacterized protein n=1 Tax=Dendroctonus ponderosae TaxID=77166 RepID=U4U4F8_DENPD|nr:hypothetical protein D910_02254 [Dendroctonus ponderosae]
MEVDNVSFEQFVKLLNTQSIKIMVSSRKYFIQYLHRLVQTKKFAITPTMNILPHIMKDENLWGAASIFFLIVNLLFWIYLHNC